jgi:hypothetical protein
MDKIERSQTVVFVVADTTICEKYKKNSEGLLKVQNFRNVV